MVGNAAIIGRQAGNAAKPNAFAFKIKRYAVVDQFIAGQRRDAFGPRGGRLHSQDAPPVMFNDKADVGPRHGQPFHGVQRRCIFSARTAEEFAARRHIAEKVLNPHTCAMWQSCRSLAREDAMINRPRPALRTCWPAFQGHFRYAGNRRQGLTPKSQSGYHLNIFVGQFGCRVAFQRQGHVRRRHAAAVVRDFNQFDATCTQTHRYISRARIDGVFDQFLQRAGWSFHHFTGSDPVDQIFREPSY